MKTFCLSLEEDIPECEMALTLSENKNVFRKSK